MNNSAKLGAAALLVFLACDRGPEPEVDAAAAEPIGVAEREGSATPPALHAASGVKKERKKHRATKSAGRPLRVAPGGKAAFLELERLIAEHYVDGPLSEDALYTAAAEGVLDRLIQLPEHPVNTLMSPEQLEELKIGTQGKLLGIGVMIERVADVVVIRDVIDGGPAAAAELKGGDRILGIDGERVAGLELGEIVSRIRGAEGTEVELFVQRDTEEWDQTLTRGQIEVASVEGEMLDDDTAYIKITSFAKNTAAEVDALLEIQAEAGAKSIVLDLRSCPGGLLDAALEVASRFLPEGQRIVTVENRAGEPTHHLSEGQSPWQKAPLVVLVGPHTASGAEIIAAAIQDNERGSVVGETTMGKATVESIHELSNHWAVKLSIRRFYSPNPEKRDVHTVRPDIRVPGNPELSGGVDDLDPAIDAQLGAAMELLESR